MYAVTMQAVSKTDIKIELVNSGIVLLLILFVVVTTVPLDPRLVVEVNSATPITIGVPLKEDAGIPPHTSSPESETPCALIHAKSLQYINTVFFCTIGFVIHTWLTPPVTLMFTS